MNSCASATSASLASVRCSDSSSARMRSSSVPASRDPGGCRDGGSARVASWTLTAIMLVAYFGYVALIAFDKAVLARPLGGGVTSIGIPIGVGIILLGIVLTGVYVRRANREFDPLVRALRDGDAE